MLYADTITCIAQTTSSITRPPQAKLAAVPTAGASTTMGALDAMSLSSAASAKVILRMRSYCQPPAKRSVIPLANMIETTPTRGLRKRKHSHVSVLDPAQAAAYFLGEGQFHHDGEKYRDMHTIDTNERAWRDAIRKDQGTLPRYKVDPWLGWVS